MAQSERASRLHAVGIRLLDAVFDFLLDLPLPGRIGAVPRPGLDPAGIFFHSPDPHRLGDSGSAAGADYAQSSAQAKI